MARGVQETGVHLPDIHVGAATFYNAEVLVICGTEYVRFLVSTDAVRGVEGLIENDGKHVTLDRRTWDSMAAACAAKEAA